MTPEKQVMLALSVILALCAANWLKTRWQTATHEGRGLAIGLGAAALFVAFICIARAFSVF